MPCWYPVDCKLPPYMVSYVGSEALAPPFDFLASLLLSHVNWKLFNWF